MSDERVHWTIYESPIGPLTLVAGPGGLSALNFPGRMPVPPEAGKGEMPEVVDQLEAYFAGERRVFEVELDMQGTPLQRAVWRELLEIPYGETTSYGEVAARIDWSGDRADVEPHKRARAVGSANGRNPVSIIVPCHRVIGADGSLVGFGGGIARKRWLLTHEGVLGEGEQLSLLDA